MQLEVKIDQEAVQAQVVQAIMNSAIGANLEKFVNEALLQSKDYHDKRSLVQRAVDDAVTIEIRKLATEIVTAQRERIKELMLEKMTDEVLEKMAGAAWAVMEGKLRNVKDY